MTLSNSFVSDLPGTRESFATGVAPEAFASVPRVAHEAIAPTILDLEAARACDPLRAGLLHFQARLAQGLAPSDGVLSARIVGEFSAGKTRMLTELIKDIVPVALHPVSSLEPQTRLQLEITYGHACELSLVERPTDTRITAQTLKSFASFPDRSELLECDPTRHRLRLTMPDDRLVLPEGDGYYVSEHPARRLFLIDTPGWNSGADDLAERAARQQVVGEHNLALIYVTSANRVDSEINARHLGDFLAVFAEGSFLADDFPLLFVVTHCAPQDWERTRKIVNLRVRKAWEALGQEADSLALDVFCIDFEDTSPLQLQSFKANLWKALLAPVNRTAKPGAPDWRSSAASEKVATWSLEPAISAAHALLQSARDISDRALKNGSFLFGMNRHKLRNLDPDALAGKLRSDWHRQLGFDPHGVCITTKDVPRFEKDHPLAVWWDAYVIPNVDAVLHAARAYIECMENALDHIDASTPDVQSMLEARVRAIHDLTQRIVRSPFATLLDVAATSLGGLPVERQVATLLALSMLECRYRSIHDAARSKLARGAA